jgi:acetylornithine deacetylase/succinyl-diaminopimelate desuccinylase-like protein
MDPSKLKDYVKQHFDSDYLTTLKEFIEIPNLSPFFDPDLNKQLQCAKLFNDFAGRLGFTVVTHQIANKSPILIVTIPSNSEKRKDNILLYGHMDKQPWGEGWDPDKGPTKPVIINDRLYGRGSADDGYAFFASLCAIKAIRDLGQTHGNVSILIESDEESGSGDLLDYMGYIKVRLIC